MTGALANIGYNSQSLSKIVGQFRRYGTPRVQRAVRSLEAQKRLRKAARAKNSVYQAV